MQPSVPQSDDDKLELDEWEHVIKKYTKKPHENKRCLRVIKAETGARHAENVRFVERRLLSTDGRNDRLLVGKMDAISNYSTNPV